MKERFTKNYRIGLCLCAIVCVIGFLSPVRAQDVLAFPGAEGFGRFTTGARGAANPEVYIVTNLNDSGPGSFRDAVSQPGRFVVFAVGGIIKLQSRIAIAPHTTIAGQTAPGEGVVLYGRGVSFSGASNTIARYLRIRLGANEGAGKNEDASGVANGTNMIFDHMSFSWGLDEVFSINWDNKGLDPDNITIQNSIIGQGLHRHNHSAGGLIEPGGKVSILKSLYISNKTRNPKVKGINEFVNNVVYNFGNANNEYSHGVSGDAYIMGGTDNIISEVNIINNYFISGPQTPSKNTPFSRGTPSFHIYGPGNYFDANKNGVLDGTLVPQDDSGYPGIPAESFMAQPFDYPGSNEPMTAVEAYNWVVNSVGATYPRRDEVDALMIADLSSIGTSAHYVYRENDLPLANGGLGNMFGAPAPLDTDKDGIPDAWEDANGLDKNDPTDALVANVSQPEYLNIEVYINSLVETAPPAFIKPPSGITLTATSTEEPIGSEVVINWNDNADNEDGFVIERSEDGNTYVQVGQLNENTTTYTDNSGLLPNTTYYYRIKATMGSEASVYSTVSSIKTPPIPTAPEIPTKPYPTDGVEYIDTNINLSWVGSDNTVTYKVYFGIDANALSHRGDIAATSFQIMGLEEDTQYFWRVDAVNEKGISESDIWTFTTKKLFPLGMIGHWTFDETAEDGTQITDSSVYENHGFLGLDDDDESIRVPGKIGNALDFSTASDGMYVVSIPDEEHLFLDNQSFTIAFWMKADPALLPPDNNSSAYIFCKGSMKLNEETGATGKRYNLEFKNKQIRFAIDDDNDANGGGKSELSSDGTVFFTGAWEHVIVVRDYENAKLQLYLNGELIKEVSAAKTNAGIGERSALILGNIGELEFLTDHLDPAPYKGMLDELKMFNYNVSSSEAMAIYNGEEVEAPIATLPSSPTPNDASTNVAAEEAILNWVGDADAYNVYLGTDIDNMALIAEDITTASYTVTDLLEGAKYFWRVDIIVEGKVSQGNVWSFMTAAPPQTGDLVGHWSMNSTEGTDVIDESSFENHGVLVGLSESGWVQGREGRAFDFSGGSETSRIEIPHAEQLFFDEGSFTLSFWMKADPELLPPDNNSSAYLLCKGSIKNDPATGATGKRYNIEFKNKQIRFAIDDDNDANGGGKSEVQGDGTGLFTGEWEHVVVLRDYDNKKIQIYHNGVLLKEGAATKTNAGIGEESALVLGNIGSLEFQTDNNAPAPYKGMLDELKIFDYNLSQEEIQAIFSGVPILTKAANPSPVHEAVDIDPSEVTLTWTGNAETYNVYFGLDSDNLTLVGEDLTEKTYTTTGLSNDNTYFWRVDAVRGEEIVTGDLWSFNSVEGELVGYWSMNATEGTAVEDETSFENHGVLVGLTEDGWTPGKEGNAFDFSGGSETSRIEIPHAEQLLFDEGSFAISFWMKADPELLPPDNNSSAYLLCKGSIKNDPATGATGKRYNIEFKNNQIRFAIDDDNDANGGGKSEVQGDGTGLFTGEWEHVIVIRDYDNKKLQIYHNGVLLKEGAATKTNAGIGEASPLVIGNIGSLEFQASSNAPAPYKGMLDELKMFNHSLTEAEIQALYTGIPVELIVANPSPMEGAVEVDPNEVDFSWTGSADAYNFYLGTSLDNLELKASSLTETAYKMTDLEYATNYFWRVEPVFNDQSGEGGTWSFVTRDPLLEPSLPTPENQAANVEPVGLVMSWTGNAAEYNVYMGTAAENLQLVAEGLTTATYTPDDLVYARTYFWKVEAITGTDLSIGDIWSFSTRESIGKAIDPWPANGADNISTAQNSVVLTWTGDAEHYDLYMGTDPENMELKVYGVTTSSYTVFWALSPGTNYYWRVNSRTGEEEKDGDVWSFSTPSITGLTDLNGNEAFSAFPNPFSDRLTIEFELGKKEKVTLLLYDNKSQLVETLVNTDMGAGRHELSWDMQDGPLRGLSGGIYFCVLQTSKERMIRKIVYLK